MQAPRDLREFLEVLEERGELRRIREPLSPVLEIPAVLRRVMERRGPALLFENVKGYPGWRVAGNIFGSLERIKLALGVENLEEIGWRLVSQAWRQPPMTLGGKLRSLKEVMDLGRYTPRLVRRAAFQETVVEGEKVDVSSIPAFKSWPRDGGRYITFGQVYTVDPATGVTNIGVYRVMLRPPRELVIHWQLHKRGRHAYLEAAKRGEPLPVAVVVGSDPAAMLAGVMPVPYPLDKLLFAGVMAGRGVEVYRLPNGVPVPASSELVLEGYVEPGRLSEEGPFGDHWGYYDKPTEKFPVMTVERMWIRSNPVYVGTVVGKPVLEDAYIGKAVERIFLPVIRTLLPEVVDINMPEYGVFQGVAIVSIRKTYPGQAKKVMMALWGLGQMALTKIIIVVDEDINVHDLNQVLWAVAAHVDPQRDVVVVPGTHTDQLDPATPVPGYGSKLGIDATRKLPEEYGGKAWPEEVEPDPQVEEEAAKVLEKLGLA
ncbi:menaquinone biosynthesis decarboxylase [Hyperthermus butylicus]|uniref:3-octaprenyl-4-hydroxybenzoate carboxy-lyase n=1 Tax=Hyperthermus butylicus (strain DSM 5456 / JCM 9403 / PLM1-5) TaxID=415426 RepID=A2BMR3_HYPBU|nr:menaquinone biosynthesis decarboxylase [Hyperthermus butylicus]ABM81274.1 3-octaprenyl-4-hydroxybenzoate carboxy-lyase [Hyperthermus butylicus DSM 5456]